MLDTQERAAAFEIVIIIIAQQIFLRHLLCARHLLAQGGSPGKGVAPVLGNFSLSSGSDWGAGAQEHPARGQEGEGSRVLFRTHGRN